VIAIQEDVPLAPLTTLQVGGRARSFVDAASEEDVREAVDLAATKNLPLLVLGGGSNLVVSDTGWPGLVLKISIGGVTSNDNNDGGSRVFEGGAGVEWDHLVAEAVASGYTGIECLSGIPGSVGGTPVQNVGAYGQEVSDTIESVRALDLKDLRTVELSREACGFHYRTSIFNTSQKGRYIILAVSYRLIHDGAPDLKYGDLQKYFVGSGTIPSLAQIRNAVREIRRSKGMLIVAGDPDCRSAGSFFKNPVLGKSLFLELTRRAEKQGLTIPSYPALDAQRKISAAWLVEHSGFAKGYRLANAAISQKHALALINTGKATAMDIVTLKEKIQDAVREAWGIVLEPEPVFVGF
jgi:UDP-N-acetylmuramate dehydrogenase